LRKQRQQRLLVVGGILAVVLLVAALLIVPSIIAARAPVGEFVSITPVARPAAEGRSMGDPNAPVKIEVWEDFQCPSCQIYSEQTEPQVVDTYIPSGQVYYVFRHFPFIDDRVASKESDQAANASMCAADQNRFWDYHDMLFANWNNENAGAFADKRLVAFAESLGLDMNAFNACFESNQHRDEINQDLNDGRSAGVTGTPSVFVNGVQVAPGFVPTFEQIQAAVEAELAQ
jgi:protein-disulfide isomerase